MDNKKRIENMAESKYHTIFGVDKSTFDGMLAILEVAYREMRKKGGRARRLSVLDMLIVLFGYYHDYRTMENIAFDYDCHKQRICEAIAWVEKVLVKDGTFALPSKRELVDANTDMVIAIVDVTECETERPKKTERQLLRQAKMPHNQRPNHNQRSNGQDNLCTRSERSGSRLGVIQAE